MEKFDVIVLGLGAMGSAATYQLAKRGCKVLGIDQNIPGHKEGSSHGETRITRLAIGEGEEYVPFALRSHQIWREIEQETGERLYFPVGGLIISSQASVSDFHNEKFFETTVDTAVRNNIEHEKLSAGDIRKTFPQFNVKDDEVGYYEREAGYLLSEVCIKSQLNLAKKNGAVLRISEKVLDFKSNEFEVVVTTQSDVYVGKNLVISAGPWLPNLIGPKYSSSLKVYRQVLYWFDIEKQDRDLFAPERCPVFIWELQERQHGIYGFPAVNGPKKRD